MHKSLGIGGLRKSGEKYEIYATGFRFLQIVLGRGFYSNGSFGGQRGSGSVTEDETIVMATAAQLAANFANSQRSTGPRSAKGRARSAMNAVKHGMCSKRIKMLREDSIAFENRHIKWIAQANVQDDREEFLTYLNVSQALDCDRILRANEQWIEDLVEESEAKEAEEVYKLGKRLFFDRRGHIELYGIIRCFDGNKTTSPNDQPIEADDPAKLVEELEKSAEGCRWLREEWLELREPLEQGRYWLGYHRIKAVRLLGRQPINAVRR